MSFDFRRTSLMLDILMPITIVLIFIPPCMMHYAPSFMSYAFLIQKVIFLFCFFYFFKHIKDKYSYFWILMAYLLWLIAVTWIRGNSIGDIGSYLNIFSLCVIAMYCIKHNPQKFTGYVAFIFTLWMFLNSALWKDGGMYLNSDGQMCYVLGTKTSITYYQITACSFIGLYDCCLKQRGKYKAKFLYAVLFASTLYWNIRQPISTSIMCLAVFFILLIIKNADKKIIDKIFNIGFTAMLVLNIGVVFFNAQMLFANFITGVLHESTELNARTFIWKVVLEKIAANPLLGYGLNSDTFFAVGGGVAAINQSTHNNLLYLLFCSGIIGTVYFYFICYYAMHETKRYTKFNRMICIVLICFGLMWITEQLKGFEMIFLCLISYICCTREVRSESLLMR